MGDGAPGKNIYIKTLSQNISIGLVLVLIGHLVHHGIRNTERGKKALRPVDWSRWVHLGEGDDDLKIL